jgi:putative endopeptidase
LGDGSSKENFPDAVKKRYTELLEAIETAFHDRISRLEWMSETTKEKAERKLSAVAHKLGYPDKWLDYSSLAVSRKSYCENMMDVARWRFNHMLNRFGKPVDRSEWRMTPQTINAYYNPLSNEIVFPAAVFVVPGARDSDLDDALIYGYVGAIVGHEITHGFDDRGRKFDENGNRADWWASEDAKKFSERAESIEKQFNEYEPLPGFRINGKATLDENIADLGGVRLALDAFKKKQTNTRNLKRFLV